MNGYLTAGEQERRPPLELPSLAPAIFLALAIAVSYSNALRAPFHFDDWHTLEENPHIRSLANVPRFFFDANTTSILHENKDLRPVLVTTFALNYAISGSDPWSYHLVNLLLHWASALLIFRIVRDHFWLGDRAVPIALAASLLVAVHPLNTEPVNYISARSALLTAVFYLGAFDSAVRGRRLLAAFLFAAALLTKAIAVTLPLAILGYWLIARARPEACAPALSRRFLAALFGIAAASVAYRLVLLPPWVVGATHDPDVTPWIYFMTEWSALLHYMRLFLFPDALVIDRLDYPLTRSFLEPRAWGSLVVLAGIVAIGWKLRRRLPAMTFAIVWFFVALSAESSFFPLAEPVNEHRPYLAMLGLGALASVALWHAAAFAARRSGAPAVWVFAVIVTAAASLLGAVTFVRNRTWQDELTIWLDATEKAPANARAWLNAGHAAVGRGDLDRARSLLNEGYRLSPCYAYILLNLSALETRVGDRAAALRWAEEAVDCNPGFALTHYYRALAVENLNRFDEALADYRRTTAIDDQHADAWLRQARLLEWQKSPAEAARAYERAFAADPTRAQAAAWARQEARP